MEKNLRRLVTLVITTSLLVFGASSVYASTLQGFQGGTGISTSTSGNDLNCLKQSSSTPYLTWTLGTCGSGGSSSVTSTQFGFGDPSNVLTSSSTFTTQSFDTVRYADQFAGADMGAKINAAYASCPTTGCEIFVPAGTWDYSTDIVFNVNSKIPQLFCSVGGGLFNNGGTTLHYTGSGKAISGVDTNNYVLAGEGITNCNIIGPAGSGNIGSSTISSSYGVYLDGASLGSFGFALNNVHISGFGTGLYIGRNQSFITVDKSVINKNGRNIDAPNVSGANGENLRVTNSVIADSNSAVGSIANNCVAINWNGNNQWHFFNNSFDDCQIAVNTTSGPAVILYLTNNHFENPNSGTGAYDFITMASNNLSNTVVDVGNDFQNDFTSSTNEFVLNGGNFISFGDILTNGPNVTSSIQRFVTNQDIGDHFTWSGLVQSTGGTVATSVIQFVVGSTLYGPQGYVTDSNGPVLFISNTTSTNPFVGIGTGNPSSTLAINGNSDIGYGGGTAAPLNGLLVKGDTIIGSTTDAGFQFTVVGSSSFNGSSTFPTLKNTLHASDTNGLLVAYAGSSCAAGSVVNSVSATGTVFCIATSTIASGANPTATVGTAATNGVSNQYMRADGAPAINQAGAYAFSALGNTTSTANIGAATIKGSTSGSFGTTTASGTLYVATSGPLFGIAPTGAITIFSNNLQDVSSNKYSTSTAASLAGAYLGTSGSQLTASTTLASSSVAFIFQNATTTKPSSFQNIYTNTKKTIAYVDCYEFAAATTTMELYYNTTNASTGIQQVILPSITCGIGGSTTTTFTTSTLPMGAYLFAIVSSTIGTPTQTTINISALKL